MIIKLKDKETSRTVRWLSKALSKDKSRPILNCIRVEGDKTVAADGFRMHIIPTPEDYQELEGKTIEPLNNITVTPNPVEYREDDGNFPDWNMIREPLNKRSTVTFAVNQNLLADLKDMPAENGRLFISIEPGKLSPILVNTDVPGVEAVIMPMRKD